VTASAGCGNRRGNGCVSSRSADLVGGPQDAHADRVFKGCTEGFVQCTLLGGMVLHISASKVPCPYSAAWPWQVGGGGHRAQCAGGRSHQRRDQRAFEPWIELFILFEKNITVLASWMPEMALSGMWISYIRGPHCHPPGTLATGISPKSSCVLLVLCAGSCPALDLTTSLRGDFQV